jgi:hypothetical protein
MMQDFWVPLLSVFKLKQYRPPNFFIKRIYIITLNTFKVQNGIKFV